MGNGNSSLKIGKDERMHQAGDSTDRLSDLPDSILHHILSFLETKSVVQTCVLSKRWQFVWKHVPVIDIRADPFGHDEYESPKPFGHDEYESFKRFVDKVLSLRDPLNRNKMNLYKLVFIDNWPSDNGREIGLYARVFRYALSHKPQHLVIDLQNSMEAGPTQYPFSDMLGSVSDWDLESLYLSCLTLGVGFQSSSFRMLTKLELFFCTFLPNQKEVIEPFSRFPCLKDLRVCQAIRGAGEERLGLVFRILGPELLSLDLSYNDLGNIEVDAPKLKSFTLFNPIGGEEFFSKLTLPSLDYADISAEISSKDSSAYKMQYCSSLFQGLNKATSLKIGWFTVLELMTISHSLEQLPSPFTRLKSLILVAADHDLPSALLNYFLKGSSKPTVRVISEGRYLTGPC